MNINDLREVIKDEQGQETPDVDPNGPREDAKIVLLLESPGINGAGTSKVCSPWLNLNPRDRTAGNQRTLLPEAGLDKPVSEKLCLWWNAVPWFLFSENGKDRNPTRSEKDDAVPYLQQFIEIVQPAAVVAMGKSAQRACTAAGVEYLKARHPSRYRRATVDEDLLDPLREALDRAQRQRRE